jgi:hypothetical protein
MTRQVQRRGLRGSFAVAVIAVLLGGPGTGTRCDEDKAAASGAKPTVEQLMATLAHGGAEERMHAAHRLGKMKSKEAVPALICALNDRSQSVRGWSAWALGEIGDEAAIDPLIIAMETCIPLLAEDHFLEQTRCLDEFDAALEKLSGHDFGLDTERWRKWKADHDKAKSSKKE